VIPFGLKFYVVEVTMASFFDVSRDALVVFLSFRPKEIILYHIKTRKIGAKTVNAFSDIENAVSNKK